MRGVLPNAVLFGSLLLPVALASPLPLQDLPSHEQVVAALAHGLAWTGCSERLALDPAPRPYAVAYFLWAGLARLLGLALASRLLVLGGLVGGAWAGRRLVRVLAPHLEWRAALVAIPLWCELYYLGFVQFLLALPGGLWLLARELARDRTPGARARLGDAALLLTVTLLHPWAGFLAGLCLLPCVALRARALGSWRQELLGLVALAGPPLLWSGLVALAAPPRPPAPDYGLSFLSVGGALRALLSWPVNAYGSLSFATAPGGIPLLAAGNLLAWGLGLAALFSGPRLEPAPDGAPPWRRPAHRALLIGLPLGLMVLPHSWRDGSLLSVRLLPLLWPLLLAWAPARREVPAGRACALGALGLAGLVAAAAHVGGARERRQLDPALARMEPGACLLVVGSPLPSRFLSGVKLNVHLHAEAAYHAAGGGLGRGGHVTFSNSPVVVVAPLPPPPAAGELPPVWRYVLCRGGVRLPWTGLEEVALPPGPWRLYRRPPPASR